MASRFTMEIGERECVSIWQLDGQVSLVEGEAHVCDTLGCKGKADSRCSFPPSLLLHTVVLLSHVYQNEGWSAGVRVAVFAQVSQEEALGIGGHVTPQSETLPRFEIQVASNQTRSHD